MRANDYRYASGEPRENAAQWRLLCYILPACAECASDSCFREFLCKEMMTLWQIPTTPRCRTH